MLKYEDLKKVSGLSGSATHWLFWSPVVVRLLTRHLTWIPGQTMLWPLFEIILKVGRLATRDLQGSCPCDMATNTSHKGAGCWEWGELGVGRGRGRPTREHSPSVDPTRKLLIMNTLHLITLMLIPLNNLVYFSGFTKQCSKDCRVPWQTINSRRLKQDCWKLQLWGNE